MILFSHLHAGAYLAWDRQQEVGAHSSPSPDVAILCRSVHDPEMLHRTPSPVSVGSQPLGLQLLLQKPAGGLDNQAKNQEAQRVCAQESGAPHPGICLQL